MADYITSNDMITARLPYTEVIRLCDDEQTAYGAATLAAAIVTNSAIQDRIDECINDAESMVNTALHDRYEVPISPTNNTLEFLGVFLTIGELYGRRAGELEMPKQRAAQVERAKAMLMKLSEGTLKLGIVPQPTVSAANASDSKSDPTERLFTNTTLSDF